MKPPITEFKNENRWLSNFWPSPITVGGIPFPTVEHFYQAMKASFPEDFQQIKNASTPGRAKRLAKGIVKVRNWETIKFKIMYIGVVNKFMQNVELRRKLLDTGDSELVEGNYWHDNYWGKCWCDACLETKGENFLGKILMYVRDNVVTMEIK